MRNKGDLRILYFVKLIFKNEGFIKVVVNM